MTTPSEALSTLHAKRAEKRERTDEDHSPLNSIRTQGTMFGRRFDGMTVLILAGPQQIQFTAHASMLSCSPVFQSMISGPFEEGITRVIKLPQDDADAAGMLLECLYSYDHSIPLPIIAQHGRAPGPVQNQSQTSGPFCEKLADLYILADKYLLPTVQQSAVIGFHKERLWSCDAPLFFRIVKKIYDNTPPKGGAFRHYFQSVSNEALGKITNTEGRRCIHDLLYCGGELAVDLFQGQSLALVAKHHDVKNPKAVLELERKTIAVKETEERRLRGEIVTCNMELNRLKGDYASLQADYTRLEEEIDDDEDDDGYYEEKEEWEEHEVHSHNNDYGY